MPYNFIISKSIIKIRDIANVNHLSKIKNDSYFVHPKPIYIGQFAGASQIVNPYSDIRDKKASRRFGAQNLQEFSYWAGRSCAIAAVQMVLKTIYEEKFTQKNMSLVNECLALGGYDIKTDIGWYHKPLIQLLKKYNLKAESKKYIPSSQLALDIYNKKFVMASIKYKSGTSLDSHILLLYGVKIVDNQIVGFNYHDPSDYKQKGDSKFIQKSDFDKIFTNKAVTINYALN